MGGRGASSGKYRLHGKDLTYGDEYKSLLTYGNIKFLVMKDDSRSATAPRETMTEGRVYVTINEKGNPASITYFDNNKRVKQIDLDHYHKKMKPHTHHGYNHNENDGKKGGANLTPKEKKMVERVERIWYNYKNGS